MIVLHRSGQKKAVGHLVPLFTRNSGKLQIIEKANGVFNDENSINDRLIYCSEHGF